RTQSEEGVVWGGGVGGGGILLSPAGGVDFVVHLGVKIDHGGVGSPRPAEIDGAGDTGIGGELAVVDDEAGVLGGIMLRLCGDVAAAVWRGMNLAVFEDGF